MRQKKKHSSEGKINDMEQYGRWNNIRISGARGKENETIEETETAVVQTLNAELPRLDLYEDGAIKYNDHNDSVQVVNYTNFKYWLELPWS